MRAVSLCRWWTLGDILTRRPDLAPAALGFLAGLVAARQRIRPAPPAGLGWATLQALRQCAQNQRRRWRRRAN